MQFLKITAALFLILFLQACLKKLDNKPSSAQATAESIADLQRLLDNQSVMNANRPFLLELGADDFFTPTVIWKNLDPVCQLGYIWEKDPFLGADVNDWNSCFSTILFSNIALEKVRTLKDETDTAEARFVRGQAHFHRAYANWLLAQLFCKAYDNRTASTDPGLPLRLSSNAKTLVNRSTVQETYNHIIRDLLEAKTLLPAKTPIPTRPSLLAAEALLAKVFLSMGDTEKAWDFANQVLLKSDTLIDYNGVRNSGIPFRQFNEETIFYATMGAAAIFNNGNNCPVDTLLYASYNDNDLRKELFFTNGNNNYKIFKGSYSGSTLKFCGITTAEILLIRAECYARKDQVKEAIEDLNTLMKKRWKVTVPFQPFHVTGKEAALDSILNERRKEMIFRCARWIDIKRLNVKDKNITLTRKIDNRLITLPARDLRFIYPIPAQEVLLNPMEQN
ncbi:RagB/SusD family nutrient uptake outer membrane protein [Longitalea luteola]|uniref:RagB/SusD family nutrient uptake outer membrane protein n=1 Tax=Longitalea luteola TaxID=2812563 RepID=UPI001A973AFF|nr:RagB/SusD family nutrient uptake outer membrane protein [Longitalea luteola]